LYKVAGHELKSLSCLVYCKTLLSSLLSPPLSSLSSCSSLSSLSSLILPILPIPPLLFPLFAVLPGEEEAKRKGIMVLIHTSKNPITAMNRKNNPGTRKVYTLTKLRGGGQGEAGEAGEREEGIPPFSLLPSPSPLSLLVFSLCKLLIPCPFFSGPEWITPLGTFFIFPEIFHQAFNS
jgi:hypothetical protein